MIFQVTLKPYQTNDISRVGRYFYLLTAPDEVRIRFRNINGGGNTDFASNMREGMSADFDLPVDTVELTNETENTQYIEFWLSNTKLDYSKLAAAGASAFIGSGRAMCGLGRSIAVPASVRRKAVKLQSSGNVIIGGADVDRASGYVLAAGDSLDLNTRGAIYAWVDPVKLNDISTANTLAAVPTPAEGGGFQHVDSCLSFFADEATKNLIAAYGRMVYSEDGGQTFHDTQIIMGQSVSVQLNQLGQTKEACFVFTKYDGQIGVTYDGGKTLRQYAVLNGSKLAKGGFVSESFCYCGWMAQDAKNILLAGSKAYETFDGGGVWHELPPEVSGSKFDVIHKTSQGIIFYARSGGVYRLDSIYNQWDKVLQAENQGSDDAFFSLGKKIYYLNKKTYGTEVYYSDDGGDTWTSSTIGANCQGLQLGQSLLISDINKIGVISEFGNDIIWYDAETTVNGYHRGGLMACDGDNVYVRQKWNGRNSDPKTLVFPVALAAGEKYAQALQYIEELA